MLILQTAFPVSGETITVAYITSDLARQSGRRVPVIPTASNGLRQLSEVMADMVQTISVASIGKIIGHLDSDTMQEVDAALRIHLGLP